MAYTRWWFVLTFDFSADFFLSFYKFITHDMDLLHWYGTVYMIKFLILYNDLKFQKASPLNVWTSFYKFIAHGQYPWYDTGLLHWYETMCMIRILITLYNGLYIFWKTVSVCLLVISVNKILCLHWGLTLGSPVWLENMWATSGGYRLEWDGGGGGSFRKAARMVMQKESLVA